MKDLLIETDKEIKEMKKNREKLAAISKKMTKKKANAKTDQGKTTKKALNSSK